MADHVVRMTEKRAVYEAEMDKIRQEQEVEHEASTGEAPARMSHLI